MVCKSARIRNYTKKYLFLQFGLWNDGRKIRFNIMVRMTVYDISSNTLKWFSSRKKILPILANDHFLLMPYKVS